MPKFILKDRNGNETTYEGDVLTVPSPEGEKLPFTYGAAAQKEVELYMAEGDQTVEADEGTVLTAVTVKKPETLVPENIRADVKIAGIEGSYTGNDVVLHEAAWLDDICFWDIDGDLILNIPLSEAANLQELPIAPEIDGLTFIGWNYTLERIQSTLYPLDIGTVYTPSDGNTHIKLSITKSSVLSVKLIFSQTVDSGISFDWGDGSVSETVSGTGTLSIVHTYAATGDYDVVITVADGCTMTFGGGTQATTFVNNDTSSNVSTCRTYLTELYIGRNAEIASYAFYNSYNLTRLVLPTSMTKIAGYALYSTYRVGCFVIPSGVIAIEDYAFAVTGGNYSYRKANIISLPASVETFGTRVFHSRYYSLRTIIPTTKEIDIPDGCFTNSYTLRRVFVHGSITKVGNSAFSGCNSLPKLPSLDAATSIGTYAFSNMNLLEELKLPSAITEISNNAMYELSSLKEFVIPTSVTTIGNCFCYNAKTLRRLIVAGSSIESIGSSGFSYCLPTREIIFLSETPPSYDIYKAIVTSNYYSTVFVPDNAVEAYQSMLTGDYAYQPLLPLSQYAGELPVDY